MLQIVIFLTEHDPIGYEVLMGRWTHKSNFKDVTIGLDRAFVRRFDLIASTAFEDELDGGLFDDDEISMKRDEVDQPAVWYGCDENGCDAADYHKTISLSLVSIDLDQTQRTQRNAKP
jgi:hypothetical protein